MNEDGTPIVDDAPEVPVVDTPVGDNTPAGGEPVNPGTHIQPGQSPTDLDMEALLDEADAEEAAAKVAEDARIAEEAAETEKAANVAKGLNEDGTPIVPTEDPNKPAVEDPNKPAAPTDINAPVDLNDIEQYYNAPEDERYGIKPIGEIRDPEAGESAADYFKNVTLPATLQAQKNQAGFAQRNQDLQQNAANEQRDAYLAQWEVEMKDLSKAGLLPKFDESKPIDPKSEAGKVIAETWDMINAHNADPANAARRITSFDHGFRSLYQPKAAEDAKIAAGAQADTKRAAANRVLNGGGNNQKTTTKGPQAYQKGRSVTEIDYDALLG